MYQFKNNLGNWFCPEPILVVADCGFNGFSHTLYKVLTWSSIMLTILYVYGVD